MIYDILNKWKFVHEFDSEAVIEKNVIKDILYKAWKITPSKNNFMPYEIHVIGPNNWDINEKIYQTAHTKEINSNKRNPNPDGYEFNHNKASIKSSNYVLIFTPRVEDKPSRYQQLLHRKGCYMDAWTDEGVDIYKNVVYLEVGMFAQAITTMSMEQSIDTSYIISFENHKKYWSEFPFIKKNPCLIMTMGKGKNYRRDSLKRSGLDKMDVKPDFERIVKFHNEV